MAYEFGVKTTGCESTEVDRGVFHSEDPRDERASLCIHDLLVVNGWKEGKQEDHWFREVDGKREELVNPHYAFARLEYIRSWVKYPEENLTGGPRTEEEIEAHKLALEFAEKLFATTPPGYEENYLPEGVEPWPTLREDEVDPRSEFRWVRLDGKEPIPMR